MKELIKIAHRGNTNGPNPELENKPEYLLKAIQKGFYVEVDLWKINEQFLLGHDEGLFEIDIEFLLNIKDKLFCHCKTIETLYYILENHPEIECFFHDKDDCVLTSKGHMWTFTGKKLTKRSICVMPERSNQIPLKGYCYGVCSDWLYNY